VDKITSFGYNADIEHSLETIKEERREELEKTMSELTLPDEKVTSVFCVGDPANELLKLVLDRGIDLVVMGIKANDFSHFLPAPWLKRYSENARLRSFLTEMKKFPQKCAKK
jgi:nucleotide-binding universal stress UspA family protein